MNKLSAEQAKQERRYRVPYHYIPVWEGGYYSDALVLEWGHEYLSYLYFALDKARKLDFSSLLDVGCGDGRFLYEARRVFPQLKLVGVDFSDRAIALAQVMSPEVEYVCGDITNKQLLGRRFDVITLIETLEHIPPKEIVQFLAGVHFHLEDKGKLIVTVPSKNVKVNTKHYQHFDLESLQEAMAPHFKLVEYDFINRVSRWERVLRRTLVNHFFILKEPHLLSWIYRTYQKQLFMARSENGARICAVFERD